MHEPYFRVSFRSIVPCTDPRRFSSPMRFSSGCASYPKFFRNSRFLAGSDGLNRLERSPFHHMPSSSWTCTTGRIHRDCIYLQNGTSVYPTETFSILADPGSPCSLRLRVPCSLIGVRLSGSNKMPWCIRKIKITDSYHPWKSRGSGILFSLHAAAVQCI